MVAVWTAWGKSWLWVQTHPWCCPGCDHTHTTLESNLLLRAPFPSTTSSSLLANHPLLHSFIYLLKIPLKLDFHQHLWKEGAANLSHSHPMYVSELHNHPFFPSHNAWYQQWPGNLSSPRALLALQHGCHLEGVTLRVLWTVKLLQSPFSLPISHLKCSRRTMFSSQLRVGNITNVMLKDEARDCFLSPQQNHTVLLGCSPSGWEHFCYLNAVSKTCLIDQLAQNSWSLQQ